MSVSAALGERRSIDIPAGTIEYRERGSGPPIVFVHGVGVNGDLWRLVAPDLAAAGYRCIAPDLPFGAHSRPLRAGTDMSLPGLARIVAEFMTALDLEAATIVANDTGGAVSQWLAGHHPERIGRLVLTSCDAFEKFPPTPQLYLKPAARVPGLLWLVAWTVRFKAVQRLPTAYGWTTRTPIPAEVMRSYTAPVRTIPGVRRDLARLLRAVDTRYTFEAAESLRRFDKPALVVWAADDKLFPLEHGRRLAELLAQGRFETIADSRTFIPEEQPERLVQAVLEFIGGV
jgi:pimeloyl-ACP methyl ester carboxylesterase